MFKETRGLEYTLEILRALHKHEGTQDSRTLSELINQGGRVEPSVTYIQKILPRLVKANLLLSSESGYALNRPITQITVTQVLDLCDMPLTASPLYSLCQTLKQTLANASIDNYYDFS